MLKDEAVPALLFWKLADGGLEGLCSAAGLTRLLAPRVTPHPPCCRGHDLLACHGSDQRAAKAGYNLTAGWLADCLVWSAGWLPVGCLLAMGLSDA